MNALPFVHASSAQQTCLLVVDLETAWMENTKHLEDRSGHHIIEIAVQNLTGSFSFRSAVRPTLVASLDGYPDRRRPELRQEVNRHTTPTFGSVWQQFLDEVYQRFPNHRILLVAHNGFRHDFVIIRNELQVYPWSTNILSAWIIADSLILFRTYDPNQISYELGPLFKAIFGEDMENKHHAVGDVKSLRKCYGLVCT